ncbi:ferredoxin [Thermoanaerobacter kivui]|uniref:Ferredoxin n=1 Tax=Thermoanaerobacter kivui TaxID=2325 RepID=A0A097ATD4_THEKI|nr:ASKHA domain-containing protein [Thermoanaerobacter kivui]AIS53100.1 ferredoxin [Thermoanaerobacter kivui]
MAKVFFKQYLKMKLPGQGDNIAYVDRVREKLENLLHGRVEIPFELYEKIYKEFEKGKGEVTCSLMYDEKYHLLSIQAGRVEECYAVAIDIGSTTISAELIDLNTGEVLDSANCTNSQVKIGEDVLHRMFHAFNNKAGRDELQKLVAGDILSILDRFSKKIDMENLLGIGIGANTVMVHLLLNLPIETICRVPKTPIINAPGFIKAADIGINVNSFARMYILPSIGSYVGGDVVGGILISDMWKKEEVSFFIDIGTNAEMMLGNKDWLLCAAGAAGPAFEGGSLEKGMRAMEGAIDEVRYEDGKFKFHVIGDVKPIGICGTGMIKLLSELFIHGLVDRRGKLINGDRIFITEDVYITQNDIDNFMRTKAGANAAVSYMLETMNINLSDLDKFYVAGALGEYIDIEAAINIGMYPDIPRDKFVILGNTSLKAAKKMLMEREAHKVLKDIKENLTYMELGEEEGYIHYLEKALFLPHTDLSLYPSVEKRINLKR